VPSSPYPESSSIEFRRREVPSKKNSTVLPAFGQQGWMFHQPFHFVRDESALQDALFRSNSSAAPAAASRILMAPLVLWLACTSSKFLA
jgi:hypothetical protein